MTFWQVASGDRGRDYSALCVEHDVMLLGPGDPGPYSPQAYASIVESGSLSEAKAAVLGRFKDRVQAGDAVLLRNGHRVVALGLVHEEGYVWRGAFDDVQGWNLQHTHRVLWQDQLQPALAKAQAGGELFSNYKQIPMFTKVNDDAVLNPIRGLLEQAKPRKLRSLPPEPSVILDDAALGQELFSRGLSNRATDDVVAALNRQRRLQEWYVDHGQKSVRPNETEVVAYMVLPLLLALGWSEQLLAVEWNRIDLAGFSGTPTTQGNCVLVCEAKGPGHGLEGVLGQARGYVQKLALHNCRRILLTEGGRYFLHTKKKAEEWSARPSSYLNVSKPRMHNVDGTRALEALLALRPGA